MMKLMKKLLLTGWMMLAGVALWAQGSDALIFTRIERNPRAAGMAGAGAASFYNSAYAGFGKAATLAFMGGTLDAGVGFQLWAPGDELEKTTNMQLGAAGHFGQVGVSLGAAFSSGVPAGDFAPTQRIVGLGFAYKMGRYLGVGVNLRYAGETLAPGASVNGFSSDLSVAAQIPGGFSAILGISTLGTRVKGSQADMDYPQPAYLFGGVAWHRLLADVHEVELALDGEYYVNGVLAAAVGAEYSYNHTAFVRAGYRLAGAACVYPSHLALGLGVQFAGFRIEAAWMGAASYAPKSNTVTFGIGYRF